MKVRLLVAGVTAALSLAGLAQLPAAAQAAKPNGDALFRQRCAACHTVTAGKAPGIGPNLYGVVNRKAAAGPLPFRYSEALKKSGLTWTRANLDKYLAAPAKMVPGTRMAVALPDAAQRGAIIDYLARAK
jgi:cytochrome c